MADLLETHQELTALLKGGEAVLNVPAELAKRTVSLCEELQQVCPPTCYAAALAGSALEAHAGVRAMRVS
jgi:hypothetical protein